MEERYKNAFSEVYLIIENMHPNIRNKFNAKFIEFLKKNKNDNYIPDSSKINLQNTTATRNLRIVGGGLFLQFSIQNIHKGYYTSKRIGGGTFIRNLDHTVLLYLSQQGGGQYTPLEKHAFSRFRTFL